MNHSRNVAGVREERFPVLFYTKDSTRALYQLNLLIGQEEELLKETQLIRSINFFEKNQLLTYSLIPDQYKTTWPQFGVPLKVYNLDTKENLTIENKALYGKPPALSPDGSKLAFGVNRFPDTQSGVPEDEAYYIEIYNLNTKSKNVFYFNKTLGINETGGSGSVPESVVWANDSNSIYLSLQVNFSNPELGYTENVFQIFNLNSSNGALKAITAKNKYWYHYISLINGRLYYIKEDIRGEKTSRGNPISWLGFINLNNNSENTITGSEWVRGYIPSRNNEIIFNGYGKDSGTFVSKVNGNLAVSRLLSLGTGSRTPLGLVGMGITKIWSL